MSVPRLQIGCQGRAVRNVQVLLNAHGATPRLAETGVYDAETAQAVMNLQLRYGVTADGLGIVGPLTDYLLDPIRIIVIEGRPVFHGNGPTSVFRLPAPSLSQTNPDPFRRLSLDPGSSRAVQAPRPWVFKSNPHYPEDRDSEPDAPSGQLSFLSRFQSQFQVGPTRQLGFSINPFSSNANPSFAATLADQYSFNLTYFPGSNTGAHDEIAFGAQVNTNPVISLADAPSGFSGTISVSRVDWWRAGSRFHLGSTAISAAVSGNLTGSGLSSVFSLDSGSALTVGVSVTNTMSVDLIRDSLSLALAYSVGANYTLNGAPLQASQLQVNASVALSLTSSFSVPHM